MNDLIEFNPDVFIEDGLIALSDSTTGYHSMIPVSFIDYFSIVNIDGQAYVIVTFSEELLINLKISKFVSFKYDEREVRQLIKVLKNKEEI